MPREDLIRAAKKLQLREAAVGLATKEGDIDFETGAPASVRAIVGALDKPEDRLSTLRKTFPGAFPAPEFEGGRDNFFFMNPDTGKLTLFNPKGLDTGDIPGVAREATQAVLGTGGAILGAPGGPIGAAVGAGLGTMAGEEVANLVAQGFGAEDTRTLEERAKSTAAIGGGATIGQGVGSAVGAGIRAGTRGAIRGGAAGRLEAQQSVEDLARFGTTPSVAQATKSAFFDSMESLLSRIPGGAGRIRTVVKETSDKISRAIESKAAKLGGRTGIDTEFAGRTIIKGAEDFVGRFKTTAGELFDSLRTSIPNDVVVPVRNTIDILSELTTPVPGAPKVSAALRNPEATKLATAVRGDATIQNVFKDTGILDQFGNPITRQIQVGQDGLPFGVLLDLRSAVGRKLADSGLVSDIPRAELKRIYSNLTADIKDAASAAGVLPKFNRANSFYNAGLSRIEGSLEPLVRNKVPEKVFQALERGGKSGATQIRTVMRSLTKEQQRVVASGTMRRLGLATASQQTAEGTEFSLFSFLTRWSQLDNAAKDALFRRPGFRGISQDLDALARAGARAQESSRAFFNPSGTAAAGLGGFGIMISAGMAVTGAVTGRTEFLLFPFIMAAGAVTANQAARLMTNPNFVRWLAQSTRLKPNGIGGHIGRLSGVAATADPETKQAIQDFASNIDQFLPPDKPQQGAAPNVLN